VFTVAVRLETNPNVVYPGENAATLRLDAKPKGAEVFVDGGYMGHASDFGGRFHSMLLIPGMHHLKIQLPGYKTYEMDITVVANQKSEIRAELVKASDDEAGPPAK
jgi:hypothetical protein